MNKGSFELKNLLGLILVSLLAGCAMPNTQQKERTLSPPQNADPIASQAILEGNKFFAEHQWTAAKRKFMSAIQAQPTLAEAHYNLALTLEEQGNFSESRPHYKKAADLAPGHPVIWNAPPFRQYGTVEPETHDQAPDGHMGHQH